MTTIDSKRLGYVTRGISAYVAAGQVFELRALNVQGRKAVCRFYADPGEAAIAGLELEAAGATGVYLTPNPLRAEVLGESRSARKDDVPRRRWLLVDVDPVRPAGVSSTQAEKDAAWNVLVAARGCLEAAGFGGFVVADSGNGWHLCAPLDLAADAEAQDRVKRVLAGLNRRCSDAAAQVDKSTHDAPRIWKVPGLMARKGEPTADREHRYARLIEAPAWTADQAAANNAALDRLLLGWQRLEEMFRKREKDPGAYAKKALEDEAAKMAATPPGGRNAQLFKSAAALGNFVAAGALSFEQCFDALYGAAKQAGCDDPEKDVGTIRRGLADGMKTPRDLNGVGHANGHPNGHANGNGVQPHANGTPANGTPKSITFPTPIPASELKEAAAQAWLWNGYLSRGDITLFSALWKIGKTTLIAHLLRTLEAGGEFCGRTVGPAKVLYVSEESETRWAKRRDKLGLHDHIHFVLKPFKFKASWEQWPPFLRYVADLVNDKAYDLVVLDPVVNLWPVRDENDASQVISALMPLREMPDRAATMLVHHTRKTDGGEGTASRGSGGLTGFVDTIMEMRRFNAGESKDRRRVITALGRDEETPQEVVVELTEKDGYRACGGDRQDVRGRAVLFEIARTLPTTSPGLAVKQIRAAYGDDEDAPSEPTIRHAMEIGHADGILGRAGTGKAYSPYTYWLLHAFPS
jgi:hypothetical protein